MATTKRIRVEIPIETYEAFRYFGLLRGQPVGKTIGHALALHSQDVLKQFPAVRAHVLAYMEAHRPQQVSDNDLEAIPF